MIREFDGQPVDDYGDLPRIVASTPVNKKVEIVVMRDGKRVTLHPKIAQLEEPGGRSRPRPPPRRRRAPSRSGCRCRT